MALTRAQVDTALATLWAKIQTKQAGFYAARGYYWQGRAISGSAGLTDAPTDQPGRTWLDFGLTSSDIPASLQWELTVNSYRSPAGDGYDGMARLFDGTNWWRRTAGFGPEAAARTQGWTQE